jgi:signal transduction histidine kinase
MLLFFVFFFVPFGLLTLLTVSMSREMMKKSTMDHLQNLVEVKETAIEEWLRERISDGKSVAESQEVKSLALKQIEPFLSLKKHFERAFLEMWVLDSKGRIVSGNPSKTSFEREDWFQKAIKEGSFISMPAFHPQSSKPAVTLSFAIKDARGKPMGVLKELVDLSYISELLSESKLGQTGKLFIVDLQGKFVLHSRLADLAEQGTSRIPYFGKDQSTQTHAEVYTEVYKDYTGNEALGSWKWIPSLRCYLIGEQDTKEAFRDIEHLVNSAMIIFIASTLLIVGISYGVMGRTTGPIKRLSEMVTSFANGHFGKTLSTSRRDEIGSLVAGFNVMADKLKKAHAELEGKVDASNKELEIAYQMLKQRQEQLIRSEKMAALGQLSAGIAHEIRTPLTSIKIFIQSLAKEIDLDENQKEDFRIVMREIDRMNEHITRFLNFARPEEPLFQAINVTALVKDAVNLLAAKLRSGGIRLDISLPEEHARVEGDPRQLAQVFLNLLLNAVEAMPQGGTLTIHSAVKVNPDSHQDLLQIVIKDTGHGVREKDRPYVFDPFFTTKEGGTGLGLSIVYSIVQKHNGRIEVESESGKGSSFILSLPIQKEGIWREFSS